jgi:hypothetical protein
MNTQHAASSPFATIPPRTKVVPPTQRSKHRSLLALDGQDLNRDLLKAAQAHCLQLSNRVDILLTNPPAAPTSVLCELLIGLEKAGVDYRLTVAEGSLSHHVSQYLRRFLGITLIMVTASQSLGSDWRIKSAHYSQQGYRLVTLQAPPVPGEVD